MSFIDKYSFIQRTKNTVECNYFWNSNSHLRSIRGFSKNHYLHIFKEYFNKSLVWMNEIFQNKMLLWSYLVVINSSIFFRVGVFKNLQNETAVSALMVTLKKINLIKWQPEYNFIKTKILTAVSWAWWQLYPEFSKYFHSMVTSLCCCKTWRW